MSTSEALKAARDAGVSVGIDGDDLVLEALAPPPPAVVEALSRLKADIVALLRRTADGWAAQDRRAFYEERAGRFEFHDGMPRPAAEAHAFEACVVEWFNRNPAPSPAGRCAWCGKREADSASIVPFGTEPGTHSWLHGECWRPWRDVRRAEAVKALSRISGLTDFAQSERA